MPRPIPPSKLPTWLVGASFVVLAFCLYRKILGAPFLFDDGDFVVRNYFLMSWRYLGQIFATDVTRAAGTTSNFYRPLQSVMNFCLVQLAGLERSWPFHVVCVLTHAANASLIYLLARKLTLANPWAYFSGLLFLVHPVQVEPTAYVSAYSDPLALLFVLCGMLVYLDIDWQEPAAPQWPSMLGVAALYLAAVLSRENALVFPGLIVILELSRYAPASRAELKKKLVFLAGLAAMTASYVVLRLTALNFANVLNWQQEITPYSQHLWVRLVTFSESIWEYAKLLVYPAHLYLERPLVAYDSWHPNVLLGAACIALSLLCMALGWRRGKRLVFFGLAWFYCGLVPVSGLIPINATFLEHWLYLPMVGVVIAVAGAGAAIGPALLRRAFAGFLVIAALAFVVRSDARAAQWADPIVFYETELHYNPTARVYNNLGNAYSALGQDDRAIHCYQESLKLRTDYPQTYHNLARVTYRKTHDVVATLSYYYQALSLQPDFYYSHLDLSQLYQQLGEPELARVHADFYRRALAGETLTEDDIKRQVAPLLKPLLAKLGQ